jgi:hypothetical protein
MSNVPGHKKRVQATIRQLLIFQLVNKRILYGLQSQISPFGGSIK